MTEPWVIGQLTHATFILISFIFHCFQLSYAEQLLIQVLLILMFKKIPKGSNFSIFVGILKSIWVLILC